MFLILVTSVTLNSLSMNKKMKKEYVSKHEKAWKKQREKENEGKPGRIRSAFSTIYSYMTLRPLRPAAGPAFNFGARVVADSAGEVIGEMAKETLGGLFTPTPPPASWYEFWK